MEKFKMQYARLLAIDEALRSQTFPSMKQLSSLLEKHPRSVSRDLQFMKEQLQAPINYSHEKNGYYYTDPDFTISDISLTEDESLALQFNLKITQQLLFESQLCRKVAKGLSSLKRRAAPYIKEGSSFLASHIQFALDIPPFYSFTPSVEQNLMQSFSSGELITIVYCTGKNECGG